MKSTITLFGLMLLSALAFSQITILNTDVPVPSKPFNFDDISLTSPISPALGANQSWNYSSNFGNNPLTISYLVEANPFFTAAGIDVYVESVKNLNSNLGYLTHAEIDFNSTGVFDSGLDVPEQSYSLAAYTANASDSLEFPKQQYLVNSTRAFIHFPLSANSAWKTVSPRTTNFTLTISAYLIDHVPGQHRYTWFRSDSIVGWGKLTVHTPSGPSIGYDVLMDKIEQYAVDSFFINGSPAPVALLSAFGMTQGQHSGEQYAYNFYRKGSYAYLLRFYYGTDKSFSTVSAAFVNTDDLITGVNNVNGIAYSSLVFPNPSNGSEINIKLIGKNISAASYSITDLAGRTVQAGIPSIQGFGLMQLKLSNQLSNGNYFIKINDENHNEVVSEQISVQQ